MLPTHGRVRAGGVRRLEEKAGRAGRSGKRL